MHIVDKIHEDNHRSIPCESDAALRNAAQRGVHGSTDMLDACANPTFRTIDSALIGRELPVSPRPIYRPVLDPQVDEALVDGGAAVSAISIESSIVGIYQIIQYL